MSLTTECDGLLGTHVTWDDIQNDCIEAFGDQAILGSDRSIDELSDGKGFVSKIGLIEPKWANPNPSLPEKMIVKIVTLLTQQKYAEDFKQTDEKQAKKEALFKKVHNVEVDLYEKLNQLNTDLRIVKVYAAHKFTEDNSVKGYMLMEYIESVKNVHLDTSFNDDQITEILQWLASFHALSCHFSESEAKSREIGIVSDMFGGLLEDSFLSSLIPIVKAFNSNISSEKLDKALEVAKEMGEPEFMKFLDNTAEHLGTPRLLCHGDTWTLNILFKEEQETLKFQTFVDMQVSHFGSIGHDLARLLCSVLSINQLETNIDKYLDIYYQCAAKAFGAEKLPFTLQQVKESFYRFLPLAAFIQSAIICIIGKGVVATRPEDERDKILKVFQEKSESLMDIAIEYHPKCREIFKEYRAKPMSLSTRTDGILGTFVTWDDIQKDIIAVFGANAIFGPKKNLKELADGKGFVSKICMIDPDWVKPSEDLPKNFVVKIVSLLTQEKYKEELGDIFSEEVQSRQEGIFRKIHNVELEMYEKLAKWENHLNCPKIFAAHKFSKENPLKGYIVMEFIENLTSIHCDAKFKDDVIDEILHWIASYHALTPRFTKPEAKSMEVAIMTDLFGAMVEEKFISGFTPAVKAFLPSLSDEKVKTLMEAPLRIGKADFMKFLDQTAENTGVPRILCHGDAWVCNMMFHNVEDGLRLRCIIDLQCSHFGTIGHELARCLLSILDIDQIKNVDKYIGIYYDHLLKEYHGHKVPFTLEQAVEAFSRFYPSAAFMQCVSMCAIGNEIAGKREGAQKEESMAYLKKKAEFLIDETIRTFPDVLKKFNSSQS